MPEKQKSVSSSKSFYKRRSTFKKTNQNQDKNSHGPEKEQSNKKQGSLNQKSKQPIKTSQKRAAQTIQSSEKSSRSRFANSGRSNASHSVKIAFLGGLNEVGKNMTVYECMNDMFIVDCGMSFPTADLPGVDIVIPEFEYIEKNKNRIRGIVITHGHEDHIGGLAYLLRKINVPIYATKLTAGLIKSKLSEHKLLANSKVIEIKPRDTISLGVFRVEMIHVNHSIPDAVGLAISSPAGVIIQTGDFKIDTTPIDGDMIDLARFSEYGQKGVLALLSDSTNAERPGYTMSERKVGESFATLFTKAKKKRIIVATFASNIHRVQQIIDVAQSTGRKVAVVGRSLENLVSIGTELGYLHFDKNVLIPIDLIKNYPDEKLVIITTGSQGEPMSALTKIAMNDHRKVSIGPNDYVIISATPIPGNEKTVGRVVNELLRHGTEVIYEKMYEVHVSGHACQEELKLMIGLTKPQFFIPVHGEYKHLHKHALLGEAMGIDKKNIFIGDIGNRIEVSKKGIRSLPDVPAGETYIDGLGVGDIGSITLNERKHLSADGILVVIATVEKGTGTIVSGPSIITRGFVFDSENDMLVRRAQKIADNIITENYGTNTYNWIPIKEKIRNDVSRFVRDNTKRNPMVLPIIMEV